MKQYDKYAILDEMKRVAVKAGELITSGDGVRKKEKSSARDIVTDRDVAVQELICGRLSELYPEALMVAEEKENDSVSGELVFIIDPIDGTMNFYRGFSRSGVSIACLSNGSPLCALVYDPYLKEMFSAVAGIGAFLNGEPIKVTDKPLSGSIVVFGTSPYNNASNAFTFDTVRDIYDKCIDIRRFGAATLDLCYVAAGRAGLFFEASLSLWDYAAGAIIIEEAGGTVCDFEGRPLPYDLSKPSVLAGTRETVAESGIINSGYPV